MQEICDREIVLERKKTGWLSLSSSLFILWNLFCCCVDCFLKSVLIVLSFFFHYRAVSGRKTFS